MWRKILMMMLAKIRRKLMKEITAHKWSAADEKEMKKNNNFEWDSLTTTNNH